MSKPDQSIALGVESRQVFLDTEVFKRRGHNLTVEPFVSLGVYLKEQNIGLHTTDITLRELERQIRADATDLVAEFTKLAKRSASWKHKIPHAKLEPVVIPDAAKLGDDAWNAFHYTIALQWHAEEHAALEINAKDIFEKYFERHPPFKDHGSKEFPDAFVATALHRWCEKSGEKMYVVTQDKAFLSAAEASEFLIPIPTLEEFLEKVTEAETPETIKSVESILVGTVGKDAVRKALKDQFERISLYYSGDLHEGELIDASFDDNVEPSEFWIISRKANKASVLVKSKVGVEAVVSYEDISDAIYDKEDGVYFGAEPAQKTLNEQVTARVVLTLDLDSGTVESGEVLSDVLFIQEWHGGYND